MVFIHNTPFYGFGLPCWIHRMHLCREVRHLPNKFPEYDTLLHIDVWQSHLSRISRTTCSICVYSTQYLRPSSPCPYLSLSHLQPISTLSSFKDGTYIFLKKSLIVSSLYGCTITKPSISVSYGCRIHWMQLCRRLRTHSLRSVLHMTLNHLSQSVVDVEYTECSSAED